MAPGANVRAAGVALAAMGLYATHDVIIKTLGETYPSFQILFFASLLSFPMVAVFLLGDRANGSLRPVNPLLVAVRSLCIVSAGVCGFYAFSVLPLAEVYAILFSSPLLITVLSIPFLGERVGLHRWIAVLVGLIGVMIVLRPFDGSGLSLGHLAAMGGAFSTAIAAVIIRRLGRSERTVVLILWPMLGNFVLTGAALTLDYRPMALGDLGLAASIAALGLAAGFLVIQSYRMGEAAIVAPMQYSQIIWAIAYGWFLFAEVPDLPTLTGAGVIIGSGLYILWRESRGASANRPATEGRLRPETVTAPRSALLRRLWK